MNENTWKEADWEFHRRQQAEIERLRAERDEARENFKLAQECYNDMQRRACNADTEIERLRAALEADDATKSEGE
jgi:uncharacterized small protein (DUF1192 family)